MAAAPQRIRSTHRRSLLAYRVMAFVTGVVLLVGTVGLILQWSGADSIKHGVGVLWIGHGYLYLVYVITALNLGVKMRWHIVRIALMALAGTIPTASFFAERYVTRLVRAESGPELRQSAG
jgi:integral membrane protein